jgi:hypothetical protein
MFQGVGSQLMTLSCFIVLHRTSTDVAEADPGGGTS